jgi:putative ABC transport system substrate-binding protein
VSATSLTAHGLTVVVMIGAAMLPASAHAEQPPIMSRIGVLDVPVEALLRQSLREHGYIEGKNVVIEAHYSNGNDQELQWLAAELVRSRVDVIVTSGTLAARAALAATATIPVVFTAGDPIIAGLVASLARPGGNATGLSVLSVELTAKRLELLHELVPHARRIALLMNPSSPIGALQLEEARKAGRIFGVQLIAVNARNGTELDTALRALSRSAADGILVTSDIFLQVNKAKIAQAVRKAKLPGVFPYRQNLEGGTLASYGPDLEDVVRRLVVYVDKVLKGAKPSELPVEQISKYELIIDLRAARALGLDVPQDLLLRADEVIQ